MNIKSKKTIHVKKCVLTISCYNEVNAQSLAHHIYVFGLHSRINAFIINK